MTKEQATTVETEEVKKTEETTPKAEDNTEKVEKSTNPVEAEKTVADTDKTETEKQPEQSEGTTPQVVEERAISIDDLAMKDWVVEQLTALQAKLEAVVKENQDLKDKNAELTSKNDEMSKKYEENDFGGMQRQGGMQESNKVANETFEEYWKRTH